MASAQEIGALSWVARYRREVAASVERTWENVLDWEHLPWLHGSAFSSIDCEDAGRWGWRAAVGLGPRGGPPGPEVLLELLVDPGPRDDGGRYVVHTREGDGAGGQIVTELARLGPHRTGVEVRFGVPGVPPEAADAVGRGYVRLYTQLWDEDEGMMIEREAALGRASQARSRPTGVSADDLEAAGRLEVEVDGSPFLLLAEDDGHRAVSLTCPHRLGRLEAGGGALVCGWHGYAFDIATSRSCDGRSLRLRPAPRVEVTGGELVLVFGASGRPSKEA